MTLAPGTRLGPYEIQAPLGAGGMGEVYRARDTKLQRDVALKVLPDLFALDPDRLARFRREAQVLASLNHPNIAAIYGLEEGPLVDPGPATAGHHVLPSTSVQALVLELVEGPTLADRIAHGAIPLDEALLIARQITEALHAAHDQGIIHRDLKPANVKVRPDGTVKVLDFGLAKALEPPTVGHDAATMSPTITSPAMTGVGVLLGTAAYMAPEQAKGRPADKRSDIWAFGCVLYEMLTGTRAFEGQDVSDTLAAVLRGEPNWTAVPADVSVSIRALVQGCLKKDSKQRIGDVSTALFLLTDPLTLTPAAPAVERPRWPRVAAVGVLALVTGAAIAGFGVWRTTRPAPPRVSRTTITPAGAAALTISGVQRDLAITPDGTRVVYIGDAATQLFVRPLDQLEPTAIATGTPLRNVFIAPDGQWVGFTDTNTTLKRWLSLVDRLLCSVVSTAFRAARPGRQTTRSLSPPAVPRRACSASQPQVAPSRC
jgi:serine/threonine-protein kinase